MPSTDGSETPPASVTWSIEADGALCGCLSGEVDALNRDDVLREVADRVEACAAAGTAVRLDLGAVAFCDARTLVGLAQVVGEAESSGASAALTSVPPHLARILALVVGTPEADSLPDPTVR